MLETIPERTDWQHRTFAGRPRLEALTGVRWFAAVAVFFSHYGIGDPPLFSHMARAGYAGVTLFFVLSGFVLTINYVPRMSEFSVRETSSFLGARFARIAPAYFFALLFAMYLPVLLGAVGAGPAIGWSDPVTRPHLWQHVLAIQAWHPHVEVAYAFNPPAWSLSVEIFLYAMFPLLVVFLAPALRTIRGASLVLVVTAAAMIGLLLVFYSSGDTALDKVDPSSAHRWLYRSPLTRLGDFVLGIGAARLWQLTRERRVIGPRAGTVAQLAVVALVCVFLAIPSWFATAKTYDVFYALPAVVLFLLLAWQPRGAVALLLAWAPLVFLGELSYAFYLLHVPLEQVTDAIIPNSLTGWAWRTGLGLAISVFAAYLLHIAVEDPARRFLRRRLVTSSA
jgi:peptidoglycan/LPS O-acetylase OafA/YrhL